MDSSRSLTLAGATACSAVLFFLGTGFAPVAVLTWVAPLPVLLLAPRVSGRVAAGVAFVAFVLGTANMWALQLRSHDTPMMPVGLLIDLGMSATFTLAVVVFRAQLVRGRVLSAALAASASWTALVYLVSVANPMGLMGTFANHQGNVPLVLQTASVTGMWGIEFLVLFVPSAVAASLAPEVSTAVRVRTAAVALVVLGVALGGGALRLSDVGPTQRVAAIATNQKVWAPDLATRAGRDLVDAYADRIAALPDGVEVVVLPEQSFRSEEARPAALYEPMGQVAQRHGIDVVVGYAHFDGNAKYNYALTFPADGGDPTAYLKHHDRVSPPGDELVFTGLRGGVQVCADVNHSAPARDYAAAGTGLLLIPASDETDNGWQHSRTALLRGVEHGQAVVWSARTGTVMISDGHGRVLADAPTGGPEPFTTVTADVRLAPGATAYTRFGDWFAWLCLLASVVGVVTLYLPRRR
ncbi:apolipoprotein N-acyltransferase [Saccharothrix tamanrassetensis]|uniref:Apolipoprotein N-acyltransferase n=1 Tax=Saccharothrix tamanrassetensis TaxID=1051531 RepID=A0A841CKS6_9PSEU|nr:nitrilase-related carbon-nitrogen hydrolase [Saccharothrix tamanrassetensis]MBB5958131.1 apolipoprotein N-acyltransferase [Saccharothrix tamanrassetensis]